MWTAQDPTRTVVAYNGLRRSINEPSQHLARCPPRLRVVLIRGEGGEMGGIPRGALSGPLQRPRLQELESLLDQRNQRRAFPIADNGSKASSVVCQVMGQRFSP